MSKNNQKSKKTAQQFTIKPLTTSQIPADQLEWISDQNLNELNDVLTKINIALEKGKVIEPYWVNFFFYSYQIKFINGMWYKYTAGVYVAMDESDVFMIIHQTIYSVIPERAEEQIVLKILKVWKHKAKMTIEVDNQFINCRNGLLDPTTKKLKKHTPDVVTFTQFNFNFKKELPTAVNFIKFLGEALEYNEDMMRLIQKFMGNCLVSGTEYGKALWLYGEGGAGKSTLADVIELLIGKNNTAIVDLALISKDEKAKVIIVGKRLFRAEEANQGYINDSLRSFIQRVITGQDLQLRDLRQSSFSYRPDSKVVFTSNRLPNVTDSSNGFWRRMIPVPMMHVPAKEDRLLIKKIESELEGVFKFALEGLELLTKEGYHEPDVVKSLKEQWKENSDPVLIFIRECIVETKNQYDKVQASLIYSKYKDWTIVNGYRGYVNSTAFGLLFTGYLSKTSISKEKISGLKYYLGLKIGE